MQFYVSSSPLCLHGNVSQISNTDQLAATVVLVLRFSAFQTTPTFALKATPIINCKGSRNDLLNLKERRKLQFLPSVLFLQQHF